MRRVEALGEMSGKGGEEEGAQTRGTQCVKEKKGLARRDAQQAVGTKKPHDDTLKTSARHPNEA
jgi:hypothetical protein